MLLQERSLEPFLLCSLLWWSPARSFKTIYRATEDSAIGYRRGLPRPEVRGLRRYGVTAKRNLTHSPVTCALTFRSTTPIIGVSDLHMEGPCTPSFEVAANSIVWRRATP